jgi:hypothetical protein
MLVGYKGNTSVETGFTIVAQFFTVGMFANILYKVANMLNEMALKQKDFKRDKEVLNQLFKSIPFSKPLQT